MFPDLVSLALFVRAVDSGSITQAAEISCLTLSAASRRIALIESQFGVRVFTRTNKGLTLTPSGKVLEAHARTMLQHAELLRTGMASHAAGSQQSVRVLASRSVLSETLPGEIAAFSRARPEITLEIKELLSHKIASVVRSGLADLGIFWTIGAPYDDLVLHRYRQDRLVLVLPLKHPLRGRPRAFLDCLDYDFVGMEDNGDLHRVLQARATAAGRPMRIRIQLRGFDSVCRMVETGIGIGVLPEPAARTLCRKSNLECAALTDAWAVRELQIAVRKGPLPAAVQELIGGLTSMNRQEPIERTVTSDK